ncbi:hypothetical protein [Xenorhabdus miraniensis]|uniref:hypothetical protein n=1 Tax=Xenorhabdus miraniensis TaxID=351674 RepID=UPI0011AB818A|nr:hypothetical protein [Xenorhabdus miraniensis]
MPSPGQPPCRQVGLRPPLFYLPRPNPAALAARGSHCAALRCSLPCSPSPPRAAPAGGFPCVKRRHAKPWQNHSHRAPERRRGAACRLCAARTRRTAARRPSKLGGVRPLPEVKSLTKSGCPAHHKENGALYCTTACDGSRAKTHRGEVAKQAKSALRRFRFAGMGETGKSGSLII